MGNGASNNNAGKPLRSQSFLLRLTMGVAFLFLGITQFTASQHEAMTPVFEKGLPFLKSWIGFKTFSLLFGSFEIFYAFWLFSGRLTRLAGLVAVTLGFFSASLLFTLKDQAWDWFPLLLSPNLGQILIKDLILLGIGFFMLFEKRVS